MHWSPQHGISALCLPRGPLAASPLLSGKEHFFVLVISRSFTNYVDKLIVLYYRVSQADFLERHIKKKSYQPFWCWNFLITHEFGQTFSSFALKIGWSIKSWGYQTENDIFLDNVAFIWIKLSMSTLKGMETLKTPVNKSHLSSSNTSGP